MCELGKWYFEVCLVDRSKMVYKQKKLHLFNKYILLMKEALFRGLIDTKLKCRRCESNPCPYAWQANNLNSRPHILYTRVAKFSVHMTQPYKRLVCVHC